MMLRKILFAALGWLALSWSMPVAKEHPFLLFNDTLVMGTSEPEEVSGASCFPALGFKMPTTIPNTLYGWWCDSSTEYAFVGFSYEITQCDSRSFLPFGSRAYVSHPHRPEQEQVELRVCRYSEQV